METQIRELVILLNWHFKILITSGEKKMLVFLWPLHKEAVKSSLSPLLQVI